MTKNLRIQHFVKHCTAFDEFFIGLGFHAKVYSEIAKAKECNKTNFTTRKILFVHIGLWVSFTSEDRGRKSIFKKCYIFDNFQDMKLPS